MGAMGGKPDMALYFVGMQRDELIFLDPHLVQESVKHEEDWMNCDNPTELNDFMQQNANGKHLGKSKMNKKKLLQIAKATKAKFIKNNKNKKIIEQQERKLKQHNEGVPIKISEQDRQTYHCT